MKYTLTILFTLVLTLGLISCAGNESEETSAGPSQLTVLTHDSFNASEDVILAFEEEHNTKIQFLALGDTGSALNKIILSKGAPLGDVFYGIDNTFLSRALEEDIFEPYASPMLEKISDQFELDPEHQALPVDYGDVCPNYDIAYFEEHGLTPPGNLRDLTDPAYKGMLVVQNPATSSPGLAFLLATIGNFGEAGYLDYWHSLVENDVLVVNDWNTAYNSEFTLYGGTRPIVISYSSSPPVELIFAEKPLEKLTTAAITSGQSCFRQIEFAGIVKGTQNRDLAEAWIDFMLSTTFQEDMPLQMFVFPVNQDAHLEDTFEKFLVIPEQPAFVSPEDIAARREEWIEDWSKVVLR